MDIEVRSRQKKKAEKARQKELRTISVLWRMALLVTPAQQQQLLNLFKQRGWLPFIGVDPSFEDYSVLVISSSGVKAYQKLFRGLNLRNKKVIDYDVLVRDLLMKGDLRHSTVLFDLFRVPPSSFGFSVYTFLKRTFEMSVAAYLMILMSPLYLLNFKFTKESQYPLLNVPGCSLYKADAPKNVLRVALKNLLVLSQLLFKGDVSLFGPPIVPGSPSTRNSDQTVCYRSPGLISVERFFPVAREIGYRSENSILWLDMFYVQRESAALDFRLLCSFYGRAWSYFRSH